MSADGYSVCPKCFETTPLRTKEQKLADLYGKVSAKEFLDLTNTTRDDVEQETVREDYEFYLKGKILYIGYNAACSECNFHYQFQRYINVLTDEVVAGFEDD